MNQPRASRPYMPGYGIVGPTQGSGLLPLMGRSECYSNHLSSGDEFVAPSLAICAFGGSTPRITPLPVSS